MKPLAVTMGDACGVGPEILARAFAAGELHRRFFAIGEAAALVLAGRMLGLETPLHLMAHGEDLQEGSLNVWDIGLLRQDDIVPGTLSAKAGESARIAIERATDAALGGGAAAMVTLPVNKEAVQLSTPGFTGHTELIAMQCGEEDYTMMLSSDQLTVTHVSTHVSMLEAVAAVRRARVLSVIRLTRDALKGPLGREPRIAVAGLNAHAGENGLFGREEIDEIAPAVLDAQKAGVQATGPHPPDTVFFKAHRGAYDAVVCMYHDQGHIPLKLLDFEGGVNVTLGLPLIRTSVDHGTAFDIAYRGIAHTLSFVRAFEMASAMADARG